MRNARKRARIAARAVGAGEYRAVKHARNVPNTYYSDTADHGFAAHKDQPVKPAFHTTTVNGGQFL